MSTKILVADESPTIHKIVAMAFENEGITVEGISRGEHALEYMVEYQPDIVLADIHLPGIDGYELCREIKNFSSFAGVRVILLTSDFEDIDRLKLDVSRADDYISKPFKTEEILKKVKSQLKMPEPEKEAPAKKAELPPEPENNEVIQNEFEDILHHQKESTEETVKQLFPDDEEPELTIEEIDIETDTPPELHVEESRKEQVDSNSKTALPESSEDVPAVRAETHPVKIKTEELNSAFRSVLSSPASGPEDTVPLEPGSKPNLIEETLSYMARHQGGKEAENIPTLEPVTGKILQQSKGSTDHSLGDRIIKEHMDQVMKRLPEDAKLENSHAALEKTVREVLGEVAPKIIRKVIQEEIETVKKMKEA